MSPGDLAATLWSSHLSLVQHEIGVGEGALGNVTATTLAPDSSFSLRGLLKQNLLMLGHSYYANERNSSQPSENVLEKNRSTDTRPEKALFMHCT